MNPMSIYEFGRQLLDTGDLDPVYIVLWQAKLDPMMLRRWLLAYWCFYHCGTACWICSQPDYWKAMETAAGSKEYPRSSERRHFRGTAAARSVAYLESRGSATLFDDLTMADVSVSAKMAVTKQWVGFGPWIGFKIADMLERLDICPVEFDHVAMFLFDSPREGAETLWSWEKDDEEMIPEEVGEWAVRQIIDEMAFRKAPPRDERYINAQEAETILCKWKSYLNGHYHVGKDIEEVHHGLLRYARCPLSQRLLRGGRDGGLW